MKIKLPESVKKIISILSGHGYKTYIVGGCLRDILMAKVPQDWDIATEALPLQVRASFPEAKIIETGLKHGTVTLVINGDHYEVTTFRIDKDYSDYRHPGEVLFTRFLEEDLLRRDFTINALAYSPISGLVDICNGQQDIAGRIINCVGDPDQRFTEDALRIMRALRFASILGFRIGEPTAKAIHCRKDLLLRIAVERISRELSGILCGENVRDILIDYCDVLEALIPEILSMRGCPQNNPCHHLDVWRHTVDAVAAAPGDIVLRLTMLLHDIGKPQRYTEDEKGVGHFYGHPGLSSELAGRILRRLKFDNKTINAVTELILYHDTAIQPEEKTLRRWLSRLGEDRMRQLLLVREADIKAQHPDYRARRLAELDNTRQTLERVLREKQCFCLKDLAVDGHDLMAIGFERGKPIGLTLKTLLDMVMEGKIENKREILLTEAKANKTR